MPTVNVTHDLVLNGVGYRVVPGSIHVSRANPFAPRIATGQPTHSDMDYWDVLSAADWTHGLGQEGGGEESPDTKMYYEADGVETSHEGELYLATPVVLSDNGFVAYSFCDGGNKYVFAGGDSSIRYYDPTTDTWANAVTGVPGGVIDMIEYKGVVYATRPSPNDMLKCPDPANNPTGWPVMTGVFRTWMCKWKDKLWAASGNSLYGFDGTTWDSPVVCGDSGTNITSLWPTVDYIIIGKEDRLLLFDGTNVLDTGLVVPRYAWNFQYGRMWNGMYWYPQLSQLNQCGGLGSAISITNRTPKFWGSEARRNYGYGMPCRLTQNCNRLFALFDKAENSYPVVLKHNGLGWHPVYRGAAATTGNALYYSEVADRLFINDGSTRYQRYLTNGNPYPTYPTSGTQFITFSIDSARFDEIDKAWRSVTVAADNLTANVKVVLKYQADKSGSWVAFPTEVTTPPQQEVVYSSSKAAVGAKLMQVRLELVTNSATATPRVKVVTNKRLIRSQALFVVTAELVLANLLAYLDGTGFDPETVESKIAALMAAANTVEPIGLDTPDGYHHTGALTDLSFHETVKREGV